LIQPRGLDFVRTGCNIAMGALFALALVPISPVWAKLEFSFSGFGTLGYVISDSKDAEYRTGKGGDGADDSGTFEVDSRLGLQLDVTLSDTFSATTQGLARQDYDGDFDPEIEWGFLKAQLGDSVSVRVGRIGLPFFLISDFREVGYANVFLRPPEDNYLLAPLGSFDGVDINSYHEIGETLLSAQLFYGRRDIDSSDGFHISVRDGIGANIAIERGIARLRFSHVEVQIGTEFDQIAELQEGIDMALPFAPQLAEVVTDFDGQLKDSTFSNASLELDLDSWFLSAEYSERVINDSYTSSANAWYVAAAYRWGDFTPYAYSSELKQTSKSEIMPSSIAQIAPLIDFLDVFYAPADQKSFALGMRWDFLENAALKTQIETISRVSRGASFSRGTEGPVDDPDDCG